MLCYAMLCYANANANANAMLCYAMLCHAMPRQVMPCHAMLCTYLFTRFQTGQQYNVAVAASVTLTSFSDFSHLRTGQFCAGDHLSSQ